MKRKELALFIPECRKDISSHGETPEIDCFPLAQSRTKSNEERVFCPLEYGYIFACVVV